MRNIRYIMTFGVFLAGYGYGWEIFSFKKSMAKVSAELENAQMWYKAKAVSYRKGASMAKWGPDILHRYLENVPVTLLNVDISW